MRNLALGNVVLLLAVALAACGGSPSAAPTPAPSSPVAPADTASQSVADPPLTVSAGEGGIDCLQDVTAPQELGFWSQTLTGSTPLRITSVTARGHGVRASGGLLVPVVGGTVSSTGVTDWPPDLDRGLRRETDWAARTQLVGAAVPVQRAMLPLVHVRAASGGQLDGVELAYRTDDGRDGTVRIPMSIRFSRTTC